MPLIKDEDIDEVRQRVEILDVISTQVTLKKAGRLYKGLCPFHHEKTPSFTVNPERQTFHCFGCGEGGNAITFVMKSENLDFPDAVKALADRIGYSLHFVEGTSVKREPEGKQTRVFAANKTALDFFRGSLTKTEAGKRGLEYFKERGYGTNVIDKFRLGFAPETWDGLTDYAGKKGFKPAELLEAGLAARSDKNPQRIYDRFRGRVIFPIIDTQDRIIGFGGRVIGDGTPKYLNSPETPVFHKSHALYALNWAKDAIKEAGEAVIVEGYTDVISLLEAGVGNVVATLGTALGSEHLKILSRLTDRVVFVFDADEAGRKAAKRGLELLREFYLGPEYRKFAEFSQTRHLDLYVAVLPQGMDPADFAATRGGEEFKKLLKGARPLVDFCIDSVLADGDTKSAGGKQKAAGAALEIIAVLPSTVAREEYLKVLADRIGSSYEALFDEFKKYSGRRIQAYGSSPRAPEKRLKDPARNVERELLKYVLQRPDRAAALDAVEPKHFSHPDLLAIYVKLQEEQKRAGKIDAASIIERLDGLEQRQEVTAMVSEPGITGERTRYEEELIRRIKEFEIARRILSVKAEMQSVDPAIEPDRHDELFSRLLQLEVERRENQASGS